MLTSVLKQPAEQQPFILSVDRMRVPLVIANWKMYSGLEENAAWVAAIAHDLPRCTTPQIGICVPFPYLAQLQALLLSFSLTTLLGGAQNVSDELEGPYTGEVSASMLSEFGCRLVLVGHSEARTRQAETDQRIVSKIQRALDVGFLPVLCVGEDRAHHVQHQGKQRLQEQLLPALEQLPPEDWARLAVAYEPVWAIGTGEAATPQYAQQMHTFIRATIGRYAKAQAQSVRILYGGSVTDRNAAQLCAMPDIDGALVGAASRDPFSFAHICRHFSAVSIASGN